MPSRRGCSSRLGIERLADYQDVAYAREYLDRLKPIAEIDKRHGNGSGNLLAETARELALGMAYEDTVRVAELKIRPSRFERVRAEVQAADGQIVEIAEFLHPRVQEIADTLPAGLGRWLLNTGWARRFVERFTKSPGGEDVEHPRLPAALFHRLAEADAAALAALCQRADVPARMAAHHPDRRRDQLRARHRDRDDADAGEGLQRHPRARAAALRHADADAAADHGDARSGGDAGGRCARRRSPTTPARRSTSRSRICARCRRRRSNSWPRRPRGSRTGRARFDATFMRFISPRATRERRGTPRPRPSASPPMPCRRSISFPISFRSLDISMKSSSCRWESGWCSG